MNEIILQRLRIVFVIIIAISLIIVVNIDLQKEKQSKLDFCKYVGYNEVKINNKNTDIVCGNENVSYPFTQELYKEWRRTN